MARGANAVENERLIQIAFLRASSLYSFCRPVALVEVTPTSVNLRVIKQGKALADDQPAATTARRSESTHLLTRALNVVMSAMASTRAADEDLQGQRASKLARFDKASSSAAETRTPPPPPRAPPTPPPPPSRLRSKRELSTAQRCVGSRALTDTGTPLA